MRMSCHDLSCPCRKKPPKTARKSPREVPKEVPEVHVTFSVAVPDHLADSEARSKCMEIQQDLVDHIWRFPKNGVPPFKETPIS